MKEKIISRDYIYGANADNKVPTKYFRLNKHLNKDK